MPYKDRPTEKLYWTITELGKMFGVRTYTLRFWENDFGKLYSKLRRDGDRLYTAQDIAKVRRIYNLLKVEKFTIPGALKRLEEIKLRIF
jgi:DNA-binding transcriptional MerR regulator